MVFFLSWQFSEIPEKRRNFKDRDKKRQVPDNSLNFLRIVRINLTVTTKIITTTNRAFFQ